MEPRPQRPRSVSGQPPRPSNGEQTDHGASVFPDHAHGASAPYPQEPFDPTTFIAPPRTEYDYSPLDLAPPGERRKRQFVAAAVGGLLVVLLAAVAVFAYLMLKPDNKDGGTNDIAAAQTQVARQQATLSAQQTVIAQAADKETATVTAPGGAATARAGGAAATPDTTKTAKQSPTRPPVATGSGSGSSSSAKGPSPKTLKTYLPDASAMPQGLTTVTDADRSFDDVVKALGGTSSVESNLKKWGWSGNVERQFQAPDPSQLVAGATTTITVSVHGFASASGAKNALKLYADVLAAVPGYQEMQAPKIGDNARLLQETDAEGTTNVALYVQKGNILYRFGGSSTGGDPTANVQSVAEATLAIKQS